MYDNQPKVKQIGLIYGFKLRYIGGIHGNLGVIKQAQSREKDVQILTNEEIATIERICQTARIRASEAHKAERAKLPPVGLGK
jgi:hypothetical protein